MNVGGIQPPVSQPDQTSDAADKNKIDKAAHDFEALLVAQMLKSSHGEGSWLGTGDDDSSDTAMGMGEEQLAQALANGGGLGLAKMIEAQLSKTPASQK
jgi:Rod binding domain-containing protein